MIENATFGAGCFWGVQNKFKKVRGVIKTQVGYEGGMTADPSYEDVCSHNTGHAEVVQVQFDPDVVSYLQLLDVFWKCHNPTTLNRQGVDVGSQYRSVIFYHSEEQHQQAEQSKMWLEESGQVPGKIVTQIVPATHFYPAEEYHQNYYEKNKW